MAPEGGLEPVLDAGDERDRYIPQVRKGRIRKPYRANNASDQTYGASIEIGDVLPKRPLSCLVHTGARPRRKGDVEEKHMKDILALAFGGPAS